MEVLQYSREIIETHVVLLGEEINGEKKWIRVQKNGSLHHWKPASKEKVPKDRLNGSSPTKEQLQKLETVFQANYGGND